MKKFAIFLLFTILAVSCEKAEPVKEPDTTYTLYCTFNVTSLSQYQGVTKKEVIRLREYDAEKHLVKINEAPATKNQEQNFVAQPTAIWVTMEYFIEADNPKGETAIISLYDARVFDLVKGGNIVLDFSPNSRSSDSDPILKK